MTQLNVNIGLSYANSLNIPKLLTLGATALSHSLLTQASPLNSAPTNLSRKLLDNSMRNVNNTIEFCEPWVVGLPSAQQSKMIQGSERFDVRAFNCTPAEVQAESLEYLTATFEEYCSPRLLAFKKNSTEHSLVIKGRPPFCDSPTNALKDIQDISECGSTSQFTHLDGIVSVNYANTHSSANSFNRMVFDDGAKSCAQVINQKVAAEVVFKQAFITGAVTNVLIGLPLHLKLDFSLHGVSSSHRSGYSFDLSNPVTLSAHAEASYLAFNILKEGLLNSLQTALGASILSRAANVGQTENPFSGFDPRESFDQGLLGGIIVTALLSLPRLAASYINGEQQVERPLNAAYLNKIVPTLLTSHGINQLCGALVGASLLSFAGQKQKPFEALAASYSAALLALLIGPLASNLSAAIAVYFAKKPPEAADNPQNNPQVAIELPVRNSDSGSEVDAVPALSGAVPVAQIRQAPAAPGQATSTRIEALIEKRITAKTNNPTIRDFDDLIEADEYRKKRFVCTLSHQIMTDPVILPSNGNAFVYDKSFIMEWVQRQESHPHTRAPISAAGLEAKLIRAQELQTEILTWLQDNDQA